MNADGLEGFARGALALVLLASYKIGSDGGFHRSRRKTARAAGKSANEAGSRGSPPRPGPFPADSLKPGRKRRRAWLRDAATVFWIALLLFTVIYATVRGESGFADLDEVRLLSEF